jgi:hypothetical protein
VAPHIPSFDEALPATGVEMDLGVWIGIWKVRVIVVHIVDSRGNNTSCDIWGVEFGLRVVVLKGAIELLLDVLRMKLRKTSKHEFIIT